MVNNRTIVDNVDGFTQFLLSFLYAAPMMCSVRGAPVKFYEAPPILPAFLLQAPDVSPLDQKFRTSHD